MSRPVDPPANPDTGQLREQLTQLATDCEEMAQLRGIRLHALVLCGDGGTLLLEGASSRAHALAIAEELNNCARRLLEAVQ